MTRCPQSPVTIPIFKWLSPDKNVLRCVPFFKNLAQLYSGLSTYKHIDGTVWREGWGMGTECLDGMALDGVIQGECACAVMQVKSASLCSIWSFNFFSVPLLYSNPPSVHLTHALCAIRILKPCPLCNTYLWSQYPLQNTVHYILLTLELSALLMPYACTL